MNFDYSEEQLLTLSEGQVSAVARGPAGFHIFLLHEREASEAEVPPYDEVREYIFRQMLDAAMARQEELFLTELRRSARDRPRYPYGGRRNARASERSGHPNGR